MGAIGSRVITQRDSGNGNTDDVENGEAYQSNANSGRRNHGLYFGSHFFLGGNRNPEETWIFGGTRPDLTFLYSLSSSSRASIPAAHQTTTIKCPMNLHKSSLQLIQAQEGNKNLYRIQFMFDATENCFIKVLYAVSEVMDANGHIKFIPFRDVTSQHYERGLNQVYEQPESEFLDITQYKEEQLKENLEENYFPVVIIVTIEDKPSKDKVYSQITFATLLHCADDSYAIKTMKQKILLNSKSWTLHDIYGLENGENDSGRECVICMSEPRDTTVLPCKHMCLCSQCAEVLRHQSNKCPICRSTVKSMIEIRVGKQNEVEDVDETDEELTLIKKKKEKTVE